MAESDAFGKRERALEDEFFHRTDKALVEKMRQSMQREQSRETLAAATGIQDSALLDVLLDRGIQTTTLVALTLVPPVFVAWADGNVTDEERKTIMTAARENGIADQGPAADLLAQWLSERPSQSLWHSWEQYVQSVRGAWESNTQHALHSAVLNQARAVAKASGGVLGLGKISDAEQKVLDDTERALGS